MHFASASPAEDFPPGTSRLITHETEIILVPEPTADPNDPLNWSMRRKVCNISLVYIVTIMVFICLSSQTVFWPQMNPDLNVSFDELNIGVACNAAGLCVGAIFFIPFARKFGRRTPYILSTAVMAATSWWSARMGSLWEVYVTNLLFGLAGAMNETLAEMTVADLFFVHQRGRANAWYIVAVMIGATIAPTIAGAQAEVQGWRWSYYTVGIFLTVMTCIFVVAFEETKYVPSPTLTMGQSALVPPSKAKVSQTTELDLASSNAVVPDEDAKAELAPSDTSGAIPPMNSYRQRLRLITTSPEPLSKNFVLPFKTAVLPHVVYTAIQADFTLLVLVLLSSVTPVVFSSPPYNFGTAGVGLMLVGPFVGNLLGSIYAGILGDWIGVFMAKRNKGIFEPEFRLYLLILPSFLMGGGLILYGVSADRGWHWIYPSIGGAMFAFAMGSIIDLSFTLIVDTYTGATAESFVFITCVRNLGIVGLPFGITPWMTTMSLTNMFLIMGFISLALGLMCVPMIVWGKAMRVWSQPRYERLLTQIHAP